MKSDIGIEPMISGLLMGFTALGFAACLLLVINGKAREWLQAWRGTARAPSVEAPAIRVLLPGEKIRPSTIGSQAPAPGTPNLAAH